MKRLQFIALLALGACSCLQAKEARTPGAACYELRIYHAQDGKLDALHARFRDHTMQLFERHGMKNIAYWLAAQKPTTGFASDPELARLGERIYRGGIPDRQIAACAGCHSPNGAGIPSQYPRLSGQHAEYTETQLKHFRDGTRANNAQMTGVAAKMNDREIKAVSDYIAGLR